MDNKRKVFIGGAWPYANNSLHVGHLAALLPGDVIARYFRLTNSEVIYVSGTDSHGTPITERAKNENTTAYKIANMYHENFLRNFNKLNFSYDLYGATFYDYHKDEVKKLIKEIYSNGYIYEKEEEIDFCENCSNYLTDREIIGECPFCGEPAKGDQCDSCLSTFDSGNLINKHCKTCGFKPILKKTKQLMFKLSEFQEFILNYMNKNKSFWRWNAINETQKYLNLGLPDRAITRDLDWGVDIPIEGFEEKKIYVWIEAVLGYITLGKVVAEKRGVDFYKFIEDGDKLESYYVHGKDNIPFHTVIFPSLLGALNKNIQLPKYIISSEYINFNNEKMSKSKGNFKSLDDLINKYESDTIRFYTLYINPEKKDSNFSLDDMILYHNKFLVGGFGNFVNRNLSYLKKKFDGIVPKGRIDKNVIEVTEEAYKDFGENIRKGEMRALIGNMVSYIQYANKFYDDNAPWLLVKADIDKFNEVTASCIYIMANMVNLFSPIIPTSTKKLKDILEIKENSWEPIELKEDLKLKNISVLFNKIDI